MIEAFAADFATLQRPAAGQAPLRRAARPAAAAAAALRQRRRLHTCCAAAPAGDAQPVAPITESSRRQLLLGGLLLAGAAACPPPSSSAAEAKGEAASSSSSNAAELITFSNPSQGYTLLRPASWEQVGKAGADSLFRDPAKKSTTVGVTVYPVTIASLEQFGDLQTVGERLLAAERAKESTLEVGMVLQSVRSVPGGASIYDFEYELDSTRGRKRVYSTVTIAGKKLYIANGSISCGKESSCSGVEAQLPLVRRVTQSLTVV